MDPGGTKLDYPMQQRPSKQAPAGSKNLEGLLYPIRELAGRRKFACIAKPLCTPRRWGDPGPRISSFAK